MQAHIRLWSYRPLLIMLNNRDYKIGQNNLDYDFRYNQAALSQIVKKGRNGAVTLKHSFKWKYTNLCCFLFLYVSLVFL